MSGYKPMMSAERAERLRRWHAQADLQLREGLPRRIFYLGLELLVPETVFAPMARGPFYPTIKAEIRSTDRVLDMGTGCGIAAIIAAQRAAEVLGVDINPKAVAAARSNAELNGVARRTTFKKSDLFDAVDGRFDLVVFHPPYRWFKPRDLLEMSTTDENYQALTRFMREVGRHLAPGGRILLQFATSGDLDYLRYLIDQQGFKREVVATDRVIAERLPITYYVYRLTDPLRRADDNEGIEVSRRRRRQRPPEARAG